MNRLEWSGRIRSTLQGVGLLVFALLIITSHPSEALAAVAAPTSLAVTSTRNTQISVSWAAAAGAARYQVERAANAAGPFTVVGNPTANSFTDGAVVAGKTYIYRVRAIDSVGNPSRYSNNVVATAVTFTDETLTAGVTPVKAVHFTELRQAVDSVRTAAGLPNATWTDANLVGAPVRAVHMQEMRDSLSQALAALKVAAPPFTDPTLAAGAGGTAIKKVHIEELRRYTASGVSDEIVVDPGTLPTAACPAPQAWPAGSATIVANVVALDQVLFYNRLGAVNPAGMIFALERDVVKIDETKPLGPGNAQLRRDKRPRPLTLRVNAGQKLQINFKNWLAADPKDDNQPHTRTASVHAMGLQLVNGIADDGSNVGRNVSSLVQPGGSATYTYFAEREGNHLLYSTAATTGGEGDGGSLAMGLFGSVNVEPRGAEWYRSQVTAAEMRYATKLNADGTLAVTPGPTGGQPIICYDAVYPTGHPRAGQPVLKMLHNGEIVHSDLNALITGPGKGRFPAGTYRPIATEPDREQPFREFTVVYHDEIKAVQAFPQFEDGELAHTLHSVRDGFAINYGTGGIGAEILANRLGVGPMGNCAECLYEEFFLSSWAVGDPAQVVDVPANALDPETDQLKRGPKATKVLYPDDPSNVHHSYLNDHVKMRVVHAGPKEHHVHHLHAHQWLHTPDSDNSSYLDSQALGPGYSFTTEIAHGGSGNRNKTPGDSIFHCHFYPHFAQGMWELWRVHDVFESGTPTDVDGRPTPNSRALPDGEIAAGTPIPGLVPLPTIAMAPVPTAHVSIVNGQPQVSPNGHPGYPFFVPGVAGHRPPHPPLDTIDDGGLPRHVITGGVAVHHESKDPTFSEAKARLDFDKELDTADARDIPEGGTPTEKAAMDFHSKSQHSSFTPEGTTADFKTNGRPAVAGAPFADPCRNDAGLPFGTPRTYKSANIQLDVTFNKAGWHFPQQRIAVLWEDVAATLSGTRPPEPLFFRANTNDCITFYHTNLVPKVYVQDDFQVRTPTDIMGQHIHLVKFDVTSSDGAGNGFNYEDGTFSPEEVLGRIEAINKGGGLLSFDGTARTHLTAKTHALGVAGAQTTVQRWFADDVMNSGRTDRTLRTVFTHDHFGPSTHQQVGFYQGLVIEPEGSKWRHPETGQSFGGRQDGGPTSWRADILWVNPQTGKDESYREFLLEFSDFQLAYQKGGGGTADHPVPDPPNAISPPAKDEKDLPVLVLPADRCPGTNFAPPCPEAVSAADPGTMVVNYRNEPLALRVRDPQTNGQAVDPSTGQVTEAGDLSHAFRSLTTRADADFNTQPAYVPPLTLDVKPGDPATPLLRAYEDDKVQVRVLVGGFEEGHNFGVQGMRWLFEPSDPNSGFRSNQMMGISEHYEFEIPQFPRSTKEHFVDYRYAPGTAVDDLWNGLWGMLRAYSAKRSGPDDVLLELPNNPKGLAKVEDKSTFKGVCPQTAPTRPYDITAVLARDALPGGTLVYNHRGNQGGRLHDPTAILYVRTEDLDAGGKLKADLLAEPLILRANAGDCIEVTLRNNLPAGRLPDLDGYNTLPMIVNGFNANDVDPSNEVGLHPQLVFFDVSRSNGMNVGHNLVQTVKPGQSTNYQWYAGSVSVVNNTWVGTPVEFGATNLTSSDPIKHSNKGAIGALIIEPRGAAWPEFETIPNPDTSSSVAYVKTRAQVTVTKADGSSFRDFVLLFQNDLNLRYADGSPVRNTAEAEDAEDSGQKAFNYRTEPLWKRMDYAPQTHLSCGQDDAGNLVTDCTRNRDFTNVLSNSIVGGEDPVTPVFTARAGEPARFRILHPGGHARNNVFQLHGHIWEEEPYTSSSTVLGANPLSEWKGSQYGVGPGSHFDLLLKNGAGGSFRVPGDYLFRDQGSFPFDGGLWGIFRVIP
ncbi:MAG: copper oxidase [Acidobacteriota bacterium]|nr:copper oxidase [Acidobacteriota bacterium]